MPLGAAFGDTTQNWVDDRLVDANSGKRGYWNSALDLSRRHGTPFFQHRHNIGKTVARNLEMNPVLNEIDHVRSIFVEQTLLENDDCFWRQLGDLCAIAHDDKAVAARENRRIAHLEIIRWLDNAGLSQGHNGRAAAHIVATDSPFSEQHDFAGRKQFRIGVCLCLARHASGEHPGKQRQWPKLSGPAALTHRGQPHQSA